MARDQGAGLSGLTCPAFGLAGGLTEDSGTASSAFYGHKQRLPQTVRRSTGNRTRQLSAKQAAWLVVKQSTALTVEEQQALTEMRQANADIEQAYALAQTFGELVREHKYQEFGHWIASRPRQAVFVS